MGVIDLPVDASWAIGFLLVMIRVAAFAITSPLLGLAMPVTARLSFTLALALGFGSPVTGSFEVGDLVAAGAMNAMLGAAMGWITGLVLHQFSVAGGILDLVSGLAVSQVFDPRMGDVSGVWNRMFHTVGMTMFVAAGGLGLMAGGLWASLQALPVAAGMAPRPGLSGFALELATSVIRSGVELALPIMGVMLMLELALGLAARFAPQANVFLLGLPAKLLAAITVVGSSWVLLPDVMDRIQRGFAANVEGVLRGFGAG